MPTLDIFNSEPFSLTSMTQAVEKVPYLPQMLGSMGIFTPESITTEAAIIEMKDNTLSLIPMSQRGAPYTTSGKDRRTLRSFPTQRLAKQDVIRASEIQGIRAFGSENETMTLQTLVAQRMQKLRNDHELTNEHQRLGCIGGKFIDADGSVVEDFYTAFGIAEPAAVDFTNAAVTTAGGMRPFLQQNIIRPMLRAAKIGTAMGIEVVALAGDDFFDWFTNHADVRTTFLNWTAASELREGNAFQEFSFGGLRLINYRGTDDNSTVAIGTEDARFFLRGVPGLFRTIQAPGESFDMANTLGREIYARIVPDEKRNEYAELEVMSYTLKICTRPETLLKGELG